MPVSKFTRAPVQSSGPYSYNPNIMQNTGNSMGFYHVSGYID